MKTKVKKFHKKLKVKIQVNKSKSLQKKKNSKDKKIKGKYMRNIIENMVEMKVYLTNI